MVARRCITTAIGLRWFPSPGFSLVLLACLLLLLAATIGMRSFHGGDQQHEDFSAEPVQLSATLRFTAIAAGYFHSCAIDSIGETYCWGSNRDNQLGSTEPTEYCGASRCSGPPVRLAGAQRFTQLVAGRRHSCGLTAVGSAWCWGYGRDGQLGDGSGTTSPVPVRVAGGLVFTTLAANATSTSTCGLTASGEAWCWGDNRSSSLGNGSDTGPALVPVQVMSGVSFISISISQTTACGVSTEGDAYCWGDNRHGQLGAGSAGIDGGPPGANAPVAVQGGHKFTQVATDGLHSCAVQQTGAVYCWGLHSRMSAAISRSPRHYGIYTSLPARVGPPGSPWVSSTGSPWTAIGVGHGQTCALAANGELDCWGQLLESPSKSATVTAGRPIRIGGDHTYIAFASGGHHDCAIDANGFAYCWGSNNQGQLGLMAGPRTDFTGLQPRSGTDQPFKANVTP